MYKNRSNSQTPYKRNVGNNKHRDAEAIVLKIYYTDQAAVLEQLQRVIKQMNVVLCRPESQIT
jgi:hypothetical protein